MTPFKNVLICMCILMLCLPAKAATNINDGVFLVIDLSAVLSAANYPVSFLNDMPVNGWTDEYKTTKLVLRKIEAGSFIMGSPKGELGQTYSEDCHKVTISKNFYIGVFEITQRQWELIMGENPSLYKGTTRPVEQVSYIMIRGENDGLNWPASDTVDRKSLIGKLREKTGLLTLDLPTEAQWEYACRAGTTNALNIGKNLSSIESCPNLNTAGRNKLNKSDAKGGYPEHTKVGCYASNGWGLYDMHGNVWEWCLDCYQANLGLNDVSNPVGAATSPNRITRGGCWNSGPQNCRASTRNANTPNVSSYGYTGLRLACAASLIPLDSVSIKFVTEDGELLPQKPKTLRANSFYGNLPIPVRKGFRFVGWHVKNSGKETKISADTVITIATNHLLIAKWEKIEEHTKNLQEHIQAAREGDPASQYYLGTQFLFNKGDKAEREAFKWFKLAAEKGHADAQAILGDLFYVYGIGGVERNPSLAFMWSLKAAQQHNLLGQKDVGKYYMQGFGVDANPFLGVKWLRKAAEKDDPEAQGLLATCYFNGQGVDKDASEAFQWGAKGSVQGDKEAQFIVAICYILGEGVAKDFSKGTRWAMKSAVQGQPMAQSLIGDCYSSGVGDLVQDVDEAAKWYKKAVMQGYAPAREKLRKLGYK